jgi:protein-disulfide isomerase
MILMRTLLLLCASAFLLAAPAASRAPVRHRHAPIDWTRTVVATPDGGFRIGNPQAKVAVVEFMSFTCPHCGAFAAEGFPAIRDKYVRTGKVSFEMRSALRDRADLVAATLAQCAGPAHFFAMADALFAAQSDWETRSIDWDSGHPAGFDGPDGPAACRPGRCPAASPTRRYAPTSPGRRRTRGARARSTARRAS